MKEANHKNSSLYKILGMLCYMKIHLDNLDIGIWSIARPNIIRNLKEFLPPEIIEKLSALDELEALYKLAGESAVLIKIQECIDSIMHEISISKNKNIDLL